LLEQLPLAVGPLALTSLVVCAGTALQVATGVGLGLLAGPVLVLTVQSETAIFVAIVLNLLISLALLRLGPPPADANPWLIVAALVPALAVGIGLGVLAKRAVPEHLLHRALRFLLLAMGISLLWKGLLDVSTGV